MRKYFFLEEPVAKGRPRLTTIGGHARAFTPEKTRTYEYILRGLAQHQNTENKWQPLAGALKVKVKFFLTKPKSAKKRNYPIVKPDLDNFLKSSLDAFNDIIWIDDSQICVIEAAKEYSTNAGFIVLEVEQIENEQR